MRDTRTTGASMTTLTNGRIAARITAVSTFALLAANAPSPAVAQDSTLLSTIVVSASRGEAERDTVGSSVTVLTSEDLEKEGQIRLIDYLNRVPGVNISQTGTPGSQSTISIRGATQEYIQVRIDGIEISDPSLPKTAPQLEHLLVGDIERIEVLRGSQSALYGGEAVGGVIDITTKSARDGYSVRASAEGGSFDTGRGSVTASAGNERGGITVSAQHYDTEGFSSANERNGNTEDDGYRNTTVSAKGTLNITETFKLFAAARHTDYDLEFDTTFPTLQDGLVENTQGKLTGVRGGAEFTFLDGRAWNELSVQYFESERVSDFGFGPSTFLGSRVKVEYLGRFELHDDARLTYGADWTEEHAENTFGFDEEDRITGGFTALSWQPTDRLALSGSLRYDEHSDFGGFATYRLTAAYRIHDDTLLRTSYGTGFRAPSMSELFGFGGNPDLEPEESESFDIGIEQTLLGGDLVLSATYFLLNTDNLIQFINNMNVQLGGVSERAGFELEGRWRASERLVLFGSYTYTDTEDPNGNRLIRVPRHDIGFGADILATDRLTFSLSGSYVANVLDTRTFVELDDYLLVNARAAYQVNEDVEAFVRVVNLFDEDYETVLGYGTAGFSVYGGLTARIGTAN